jgi:hypothetical protein
MATPFRAGEFIVMLFVFCQGILWKMDSLTNSSQTSKIITIHLEKEEIPWSCITLRFFTHVQASALFSAF